MATQKIYIKGLNLRDSDREAVAGTCRKIVNLRPTGNADFPSWLPVNGMSLFFAPKEKILIRDIYYWANKFNDDYLIVLYEDKGGDRIGYVNFNNINNTAITPILQFNTIDKNRTMHCVPIANQLVVHSKLNNKPEEIILLYFKGKDINSAPLLPATLPEIIIVNEDGIPTNSKVYYHRAIKAVYELFDGSEIRPSDVKLILTKVKLDIDWKFDLFVKRGTTIKVINRNPQFNDLIKNVNIYITLESEDWDKVLKEHVFYKLASVKIGEKFTIHNDNINDEKLIANKIFDESNLTVHRYLANTIHTYNKSLILGGIFTDFNKPMMANGKPSEMDEYYIENPGYPIKDVKLEVGVEKVFNEDYPYGKYIINAKLTWINPPGTKHILITRNYKTNYTDGTTYRTEEEKDKILYDRTDIVNVYEDTFILIPTAISNNYEYALKLDYTIKVKCYEYEPEEKVSYEINLNRLIKETIEITKFDLTKQSIDRTGLKGDIITSELSFSGLRSNGITRIDAERICKIIFIYEKGNEKESVSVNIDSSLVIGGISGDTHTHKDNIDAIYTDDDQNTVELIPSLGADIYNMWLKRFNQNQLTIKAEIKYILKFSTNIRTTEWLEVDKITTETKEITLREPIP